MENRSMAILHFCYWKKHLEDWGKTFIHSLYLISQSTCSKETPHLFLIISYFCLQSSFIASVSSWKLLGKLCVKVFLFSSALWLNYMYLKPPHGNLKGHNLSESRFCYDLTSYSSWSTNTVLFVPECFLSLWFSVTLWSFLCLSATVLHLCVLVFLSLWSITPTYCTAQGLCGHKFFINQIFIIS